MRIKVVTLNIWHGGRLWDNAVEFIKQADPDILLLQEVFNEHNPTLEKRFRTMDESANLSQFTDSDFAPTMLFVERFGKVEQGNAIFSKYPVTKRYEPLFFNEPFNDDYHDVPGEYEHSPRNLEHVVVDADGTELDVLNFQGVWDLDGDNDSPQRQRMAQVILDAIGGLSNVIIGGDTNATPLNPILRPIEQRLTNIFKDELTTSFNVGRKDLEKFPGYATSVVDMLLVSPNLKVIDKFCPQVDVSDHLPLVAIIDI